MATLYIMENQSHNEGYYKGPIVIHVSSSYKNSTTPTQDRFTILSTLFPSISFSRQTTPDRAKATSSPARVTPKSEPKPSTVSPSFTHPEDAFSLPVDMDCWPDECPIYCCDDEEDDLITVHREYAGGRHQHVDRKRSGGGPALHDSPKSTGHTTTRKSEISNRTITEPFMEKAVDSTPPQNPSYHKLRKRMTSQDEETIDNNSVFTSDDGTGPLLHLLELNVTLFPELCTRDRAEGKAAEFVSCSVHISRYFSHANVTLHISNDEPGSIIQHCSSNRHDSCPGKVVREEKSRSANGISKRQLIPENHVWKLPVGSHFFSQYRFRMMSRLFTSEEPICSLGTNRPFTEYILTFQRRCDK